MRLTNFSDLSLPYQVEEETHLQLEVYLRKLNIDSFRDKFGFLSSQIAKIVDILLLPKTKLDDLFPIAQFSLNGFPKPFRLDRSSNDEGILLCVKDDIPTRLLTHYKIKDNLESFFVKVNNQQKN